ncbi:hypothetical protein ACA910_016288 [Epithemia clementina (nom. ined.)]
MISNSTTSYRAALALNNMAISLLESGCFELAAKTLSDGVTMMKLAFLTPKDDTNDGPLPAVAYCHEADKQEQSEQDREQQDEPADQQKQEQKHILKAPERILHYASKRYSRALRRRHRCSPQTSPKAASTRRQSSSDRLVQPDVQVVDAAHFMDLWHAVHYGPSSSVLFPIHISETNRGEKQQDTCQEVVKNFGILLFNLGLANYLVSANATTKNEGKSDCCCKNSNKYLVRAKTSLRMAQKTFLKSIMGTTIITTKSCKMNMCLDEQSSATSYNNDEQNANHQTDTKEQSQIASPLLTMTYHVTSLVDCQRKCSLQNEGQETIVTEQIDLVAASCFKMDQKNQHFYAEHSDRDVVLSGCSSLSKCQFSALAA